MFTLFKKKSTDMCYRWNSFIEDLCHNFTVRNMNETPVFVQSSELSNIMWPAM